MDTEFRRGDYSISTDRERIDLSVVHGFLTNSYWSPGIPLAILRRAIDNSLCFGLYSAAAQVGFGRVITDQATFAYLADVFVLAPHRGKGLAKWLVQVILDDRRLQGLRRFLLATRDAHTLYQRFGLTAPARPYTFLEINRQDVYLKAAP